LRIAFGFFSFSPQLCVMLATCAALCTTELPSTWLVLSPAVTLRVSENGSLRDVHFASNFA
jgi:hypothetical protein